jgi:hypothetical protein
MSSISKAAAAQSRGTRSLLRWLYLNPKGQPHSAFIGTETVALVIYTGEPDEIASMEVVDASPASELL